MKKYIKNLGRKKRKKKQKLTQACTTSLKTTESVSPLNCSGNDHETSDFRDLVTRLNYPIRCEIYFKKTFVD